MQYKHRPRRPAPRQRRLPRRLRNRLAYERGVWKAEVMRSMRRRIDRHLTKSRRPEQSFYAPLLLRKRGR